jgi:phosphomannomutase/phosphoglucomutase
MKAMHVISRLHGNDMRADRRGRMNPLIFREYDIRGIVDKDLTEDMVEQIGRAYGTFIQKVQGPEVVIGRDVRLSSEAFSKALTKGITATGCNVLDVGVVPTPVLYFSIIHYEKSGGVMITGSHNPIEYNGFKLCQGISSIYGREIQELRALIEGNKFVSGTGTVDTKNPIPAYLETIAGRVKVEKPLKVVVDAGNGTGGKLAPELFRRLGCTVIELYCEPDGRFPNHLPDPTVPEFLTDLIRTVKQEKADLGVGLDGDADRIGAIDNKGNIIWGDILLALYAREILKEGNRKIVFDVKCSQGLIEDIEAHGGTPVMWKTGHSLIKKKMKENGAPLAGEMSGHMFFADNYYGYDDAIFAGARLLELLSKTEKSLHELASEIPKYVATPEIRVDCNDETKFSVVEKVKKHFKKEYTTIDIDGVRILFPDGWGLVRASNTQPVIVVRFEAKTEARLAEIKNTVMEKLESIQDSE